jgi:putative ABC transport system substrate-binding protein
VKRREFITLLGGAAAAWPLAAQGQQRERKRRVGVLMNLIADDAEGQSRVAAFLQGMQELGWSVDRNIQIDIRWAGNDDGRYRRYAMELAALSPDVVLASASLAVMALQQQMAPTVPVVFVAVSDPVGAAFVDSMARPGGRSPDLLSLSMASAQNGLSFSKRSRLE